MPAISLEPIGPAGLPTLPRGCLRLPGGSRGGWRCLDASDLDALLLEYLRTVFPPAEAARYAAEGIPAAMAGQVTGDERILVGPADTERKLRYVGQRTLRRRGCAGCHAIPGLDNAQPIGPVLSEWGRKRVELLDFGCDDFLGGMLSRGEAAGRHVVSSHEHADPAPRVVTAATRPTPPSANTACQTPGQGRGRGS